MLALAADAYFSLGFAGAIVTGLAALAGALGIARPTELAGAIVGALPAKSVRRFELTPMDQPPVEPFKRQP